LTGLHHDLSQIEPKLRDTQSRVDARARECRIRARELADVFSLPHRDSASSQVEN
jgi:hypothetical protein